MVRKQPQGIVGGLPHATQLGEDWLRQRNQPFLIALADDAQRQIGAVDRADLQAQRLADPQTTSIGERQAGFVNRAFYAAEQPADLLIGQDLGQTLLRRQANLFLENSG
jgi:hypothetical protein